MTLKYKIGAVIVAAGFGLRFGEKKQFRKLGPTPLYQYSLKRFKECNLLSEIVLVVPNDMVAQISDEIATEFAYTSVVGGGKLRQDSVFAGVSALSESNDLICIHDAARPFVSTELIENTIQASLKNAGAIVAIPSNDTVKEVNPINLNITRTLPRETIWLAQTPQAFNRSKLIGALINAQENNIQVTDEATLMESLGNSIVVVEGNTANFKITTHADWKLAETILENYND